MGRGRTTTGMVAACLISTTMNWHGQNNVDAYHEPTTGYFDPMDGPSEEEAYLQGKSFSKCTTVVATVLTA
jgi:hypothetical protein